MLLTAMACLIWATACQKKDAFTGAEPASGLFIQFVNHTGDLLEDLVLDTWMLGSLAHGAATDYLPFQEVYFDGGTICVLSGAAIYQGDSLTVLNPWCATMWEAVKEGKHRVAITHYGGQGYGYLLLTRL
jgi:hypothetical protein